jgi:1-phosphatidylinositol-4-phosphate 5-kinase
VLGGSQPWSLDDSDIGELASDIQLQAEQIRRERMSKRVKQQEAEALLTGASMSRGPSSGKEDMQTNVLVGNLIGEDHVNYVLMYNMLTGIRIGVRESIHHPRLEYLSIIKVSRCQAKIKRLLRDEDFWARHKFSFDMCVLSPFGLWLLNVIQCRQ